MRERLGRVLSGISLKYKCHHCQAHLIEGLVSEGHNLGFAFTGSLESARQEGVTHRIIVATIQSEYMSWCEDWKLIEVGIEWIVPLPFKAILRSTQQAFVRTSASGIGGSHVSLACCELGL